MTPSQHITKLREALEAAAPWARRQRSGNDTHMLDNCRAIINAALALPEPVVEEGAVQSCGDVEKLLDALIFYAVDCGHDLGTDGYTSNEWKTSGDSHNRWQAERVVNTRKNMLAMIDALLKRQSIDVERIKILEWANANMRDQLKRLQIWASQDSVDGYHPAPCVKPWLLNTINKALEWGDPDKLPKEAIAVLKASGIQGGGE